LEHVAAHTATAGLRDLATRELMGGPPRTGLPSAARIVAQVAGEIPELTRICQEIVADQQHLRKQVVAASWDLLKLGRGDTSLEPASERMAAAATADLGGLASAFPNEPRCCMAYGFALNDNSATDALGDLIPKLVSFDVPEHDYQYNLGLLAINSGVLDVAVRALRRSLRLAASDQDRADVHEILDPLRPDFPFLEQIQESRAPGTFPRAHFEVDRWFGNPSCKRSKVGSRAADGDRRLPGCPAISRWP